MTLDEVIKALEFCTETGCNPACPYEKECLHQGLGFPKDALHYLKEYRDRKETLKNWTEKAISEQQNLSDAITFMRAYRDDKDDLTALRAYRKEQNENPPLTWEELKQMEGEPVWVEHLKDGVVYKAGWCLIVQVDDSLPDIPCVGLVDTDADYRNFEVEWMDMGQWQAYRKERS